MSCLDRVVKVYVSLTLSGRTLGRLRCDLKPSKKDGRIHSNIDQLAHHTEQLTVGARISPKFAPTTSRVLLIDISGQHSFKMAPNDTTLCEAGKAPCGMAGRFKPPGGPHFSNVLCEYSRLLP